MIVIRVKYMLHKFPSVYVDLYVEWEPGLDLYKHEPKLFVQIIKVVMETLCGDSLDYKFSAVTAINFGSLAGFHCFQDTNQALFDRAGEEDFPSGVFLAYRRGSQIFHRAAKFRGAVFDIRF